MGYFFDRVRNGGASACTLAPGRSTAWHCEHFATTRSRPHFSSALSCAPTATGSMPAASKAIRRHAREQQKDTNAILMGFTTRRECRLNLLEQAVFQQRLFDNRN